VKSNPPYLYCFGFQAIVADFYRENKELIDLSDVAVGKFSKIKVSKLNCTSMNFYSRYSFIN